MSYGTKTKFEKTDKLVFFSPTNKNANKEKVAPYFIVSKIIDGEIKKTDEQPTDITGSLVKIEVKDRQYKDIVNKEAKLYLKDNDVNELYVVTFPFRIDSRSLFNGLLSLQINDPITISIYENKKGYLSYSLKQNGVRVDWKYALEDIPQPTSVTFKGKTMNDYSVVDEFFEKELNNLSDFLFGSKKSETKSETKKEETVASEDIPF